MNDNLSVNNLGYMSFVNPLVSVIVPSFNHGFFITKCIESIISQTYKNFELIVIDDGSSDNSVSILKNLQEKHGFTLVFQENSGLPATFNRGIKEFAKGRYVTFCASDDYWSSEKLERQVAYMESNIDVPMCYGKAYVVDQDDVVLEELTKQKNSKLKGGDIFNDIMLFNFHPPVNYLFRRSVFEDIGYYREDIYTEDVYMNLKLASRYNIGYIDEYLSYYRVLTKPLKRISTRSVFSHLECINGYRDFAVYEDAIRAWKLRNFIWYAPYREHKAFAFSSMIKARHDFNKIDFVKSVIRLLFLWR